MDKTTLEEKRQKLSEAQQAWRAAVEESRAVPDETVKAGEEKTWRSAQKEKVEKAKKDFKKIQGELLDVENQAREDEELEAAEQFMARPTNRLAYHGNGNDHGPVPQPAAQREEFLVSMDGLEGRARENCARSLKNSQKLYRRGLKMTTDEQREKHSAFIEAHIRKGPAHQATMQAEKELYDVAPQELQALLSTNDPGFLVPEDFDARVIKDLAGFAVFRRLARVERTGSDVLVFPSVNAASDARALIGYTSGFAGSWKAQRTASGGATALTVQNQPVFGQERIQVHRWEPDAIELSTELLDDSAVDLMGLLSEVIAEVRAIDEDVEFTNGDGQGRPLGILQAGLSTVNSGGASTLTYAGLLSLYGTLRAQYRMNANWMMNSLTFTSILAIEDSGSTLIFPPNALPGTLWNRPVAFNEHLADVAASAIPIIFGDFRFYVIADRMELRIQRLMERMAPNVGILPFARLGGQTVRTNAFRTQTVSA
jgi:HK97 family phage major capsid protein